MNKVLIISTLILLNVIFWSDTLLSTNTETFKVTQVSAELTQVYDIHSESLNQRVGGNLGEFAPDFSLIDLNGKTISLDQFQGKNVLLNIWASYCPACVHEMPMLDEVAQDHENLIVIGINAGEHQNTVRSFMDQTHISYPVAVDATGEVALNYQAIRLPATWLINDQGRVIWKKFGGISRENIEFQLQEIEKISGALEKSQGF